MSELNELKKLAGIGEFKGYESYDGSNISMTANEKRQIEKENNIQPGTPEWFQLWFSLPYMTGEKPFDTDKDPNEYDQEGLMAKENLTTAMDAANELRSILDSDENLPEWVQAKITKAVDYLDTVRDYMKSKNFSNE
jgi:hypothetical protein